MCFGEWKLFMNIYTFLISRLGILAACALKKFLPLTWEYLKAFSRERRPRGKTRLLVFWNAECCDLVFCFDHWILTLSVQPGLYWLHFSPRFPLSEPLHINQFDIPSENVICDHQLRTEQEVYTPLDFGVSCVGKEFLLKHLKGLFFCCSVSALKDDCVNGESWIAAFQQSWQRRA